MKDKWRIPTVMELSYLFLNKEFLAPMQVWSCSKHSVFPDDYWTVSHSYEPTKTMPKKQNYKDKFTRCGHDNAVNLIACVLVQTSSKGLGWSKFHRSKTYHDAKQLCNEYNNLKGVSSVYYESERAEVCNAI